MNWFLRIPQILTQIEYKLAKLKKGDKVAIFNFISSNSKCVSFEVFGLTTYQIYH